MTDLLQVHPAAAVFPMLSDDELADLAEDIRATGLLHPIVLDEDGRIVDGRNRYAACKMAGIEPSFEALGERDPITFILSANIRRRQMSKGQTAMAVALLLDIDRGRYTGATALSLESKLSKSQVSQATTIRRHALDLVAGIMAGAESFDKAYEVAVARKRQQEAEAEAATRKAREDGIELERLHRAAPDLAALVPETLSVADAKLMLFQREQREREAREAMARVAETACGFLDPGVKATSEELAERIAATLDASAVATRPVFTAARFARCAETAAAIARKLASREEPVHGPAARH